MIATTIETSVAFISLIEDDVLRIELKPNCHLDLEEFEENMAAYKKLMRTDRAYLLTIASPGASMSIEARNKFATRERSAFKIAEAFVIRSLAHKLLADFVMKVQKPSHNLKFFRTEEEARKWLLGVRQAQSN